MPETRKRHEKGSRKNINKETWKTQAATRKVMEKTINLIKSLQLKGALANVNVTNAIA